MSNTRLPGDQSPRHHAQALRTSGATDDVDPRVSRGASQLTKIEFANPEIGIPAFATLVTLPLTYSITHDIGYGFITYVVIKMLSLKLREVGWLMYLVTLVFVAYFLRELIGRLE